MDAETVERLLMDRALGALSPDVEALLSAYLTHDPDAAQRAEQFQAAAAAARQVLKSQVPATLPPFPAVRVHKLEQARRRVVWVRSVASLAASLIIGVGLGSWLFSPAGQPAREASPLPVGVALAKSADDPTSTRGFWSARRLIERARRAQRVDSARVIWDSPVSKPRLGGEL